MSADAFISRWSKASPSESANSQLFLSELCDLLGVAHPDPSRDICRKEPVTRETLAKRFKRADPAMSPKSSKPSALWATPTGGKQKAVTIREIMRNLWRGV